MVKLVCETGKGKPSEREVSRKKIKHKKSKKVTERVDAAAKCYAGSRGQCLRSAVPTIESAEGECSATRCSKAN